MQTSDETLQWGAITNMMDKISDIADKNDWDELNDMLVEVFDYTESLTDYATRFFEPFQFLFRLYHRVKYIEPKSEFDQVYRTTHIGNKSSDIPCIRITNYSFKTFLWARKNGFTDYISNGFLEFEESALTEKQLEHFLSKAKN